MVGASKLKNVLVDVRADVILDVEAAGANISFDHVKVYVPGFLTLHIKILFTDGTM